MHLLCSRADYSVLFCYISIFNCLGDDVYSQYCLFFSYYYYGINKGSYLGQIALVITLPFHFEVHLLVPPPLFLPFLEGLDKL